MKKIYLSKDEIKVIKQGELLGKGKYAKVYDYNGKAIKIYRNDLDRKRIKSIKTMSKYNNDIFIFPEKLVYIDDSIKGFTQEKVEGITLLEMKFAVLRDYFDVDFELLYEDYKKLKEAIKKISDEHLIIYDLHDENVMFDKGFKVVDTEDYKIDYTRSKQDIYKSNMINFSDLFVNEFLNLNAFSTYLIQQEIGNTYYTDYMDDFFENIPKKLFCCKSLRDFKNYNEL